MGTPPDRDPEQGGDGEPGGRQSRWQPPQSGQSWQPPGPEQPVWQRQPQPQPARQGDWQQAPDGSWVQVAGARSSGKATAALVMGILGLLFCPLVCSVLALVFGYQSRREMDASGGRLGGRGNATAGIVLGWIGLAIMVALLVLFAIGLSLGGDTDITVPGESSPI